MGFSPHHLPLFKTIAENATPPPRIFLAKFGSRAGVSARLAKLIRVGLLSPKRGRQRGGTGRTEGESRMDRVVYFPDRMQPENRRKRFKVKGLPVFLLFLFLVLLYQIGSGLYNYFVYNRRLHEAKMLLREKQQIMENLEIQLRQAESNTLVETELNLFN